MQEDKLSRIERMLEEVLLRLQRLERIIGLAGDEGRTAAELALAFAKPVQETVKLARLVVRALRRLSPEARDDDIVKSIVEALAAHGPMSLRQLEREVRRLRGSASRRIIRDRLRFLEKAGVIVIERKGRMMVIKLAIEEKE